MERRTFERALHAWDEWHISIDRGRLKLGYDPKWPREHCIRWIEENYAEIRKQADKELAKLKLPLTLRQYWEDCFYCDYRTTEGKTDYGRITRRIDDPEEDKKSNEAKPDKRKTRKPLKSLPELPCDQAVEWLDGEDVRDPWLRVTIRIDARFVTRNLFDYVADLAYDSVKFHTSWPQAIEQHPVCEWLKGGRPPVNRELAIECARLKDEQGLTLVEIGKRNGWPLQRDSYGNLNQCSTARRYIDRGRELIS